ncbi:MAG: hypothetical protein CMI09_15560 [Oceanospirillaceae bacterium]|nr:hypothetical protein [Oceanospirillaceae bacterium]|tara:strand:- start:613 stop:1362 length:750 start_codon:yes stop_codon:yes gene_type:complete
MRHSALSIALSSLVVSLATAHSPLVHAEETTDTPAAPVWGGSAELGTIATTGNTETSSLNGKFALNRDGTQWDFNSKLEALRSEEDDVTSKEKYYGSVQFDRKFSEHSYIAITADQERDRFSGYTYQSTASVGYGYRLVHTDVQHLDIEAAPGYRRDKLQDSGKIDEEDIIRLALKYGWKINDGTTFTQTANADLGAGNSIYKTETGLQSQLNGALATKLTYKVKYVDDVPEDTKNTDTEFGVTLVYSF